MIPSNSLSVLMQIQPTIQRFARMLSSVLQLEVEIVDNTLCRVAVPAPTVNSWGEN